MKKNLAVIATALFLTMTVTTVSAGDDVVVLPKPAKTIGVDLFTALAKRSSTRQFNADKPIPAKVLSNLLWAANGVNRADGKRTAPAPKNIQLIEIYVATAKGVYRYRPEAAGSLTRVTDIDIRSALFIQADYAAAPLAFLFVYDGNAKPLSMPDEKAVDYAWNAAGLMEQNVALAATAQRVGSVVVGSVRPTVAGETLNLGGSKTLLIGMAIGYPK